MTLIWDCTWLQESIFPEDLKQMSNNAYIWITDKQLDTVVINSCMLWHIYYNDNDSKHSAFKEDAHKRCIYTYL